MVNKKSKSFAEKINFGGKNKSKTKPKPKAKQSIWKTVLGDRPTANQTRRKPRK